jgi:16S rRNA (guanine966-N2)-methyltransferase
VGLAGARVICARVADALAVPGTTPCDVLFADPPYAVAAAELAGVLTTAAQGGWLAPDAVVVVERASRDPAFRWPAGFTALRERRYGEATLWYGRRADWSLSTNAEDPGVGPAAW